MHNLFYFTDVHGCYDLYKAAINYCLEQDPECTIVYGGDACDRGENGYRIMKELLDNPNVIYLYGNHEDLFVHAALFIKRDYTGPIEESAIFDYLCKCQVENDYSHEVQLHLYNGGYHTLHDWMLDGMPEDFIKRIIDLPITTCYDHLDFCHAGGRYKEFERVLFSEYDELFIEEDELKMLIWDRNYLGQGWKEGRTCIFGHTPVVYLPAKYYGRDKSLANVHPCAYYATLDDKWTGRKIDMDTCAVASGKLYVLNCLTMQAQGFRDVDLDKEQIDNHNIEKIEVIKF